MNKILNVKSSLAVSRNVSLDIRKGSKSSVDRTKATDHHLSTIHQPEQQPAEEPYGQQLPIKKFMN